MIGPADPHAKLGLRGDGNGGRGVFWVQLIVGSVGLVLLLGLFGLDVAATGEWTIAYSTVPSLFVPLVLFVQANGHQRRVSRLRGTELWVSPGGVAYACTDGVFGVPWPAVVWMGFGRGGTVLCVTARGWQGPVAKLGPYWKSTRTLDVDLNGTDPGQVAAQIRTATGIDILHRPA